MNTKLLIVITLFFAFLASCDRNRKESLTFSDTQLSDLKNAPPQNSGKQGSQKEPEKIPTGVLQTGNTDSATAPSLVKGVSNPDWDKKIIKTAHVKIKVNNFQQYNDNIHAIIKHFGGYVAKEEQHASDEKTEVAIVIKVPVDQFDNMMNELPGAKNKVLEKNISTEDVTGEMVDTRLRLEAKKGMRLKYLEFLKQSKNMEEVLQVQNEINGIQEEMESAAGRIEFLSHQSAYSTINLNFYQPINGYKPADINPGFFARLIEAFKSGTSSLADMLVGLITIWPLLIIIAGVFIGYKKFKPSKIMAQNH
jgi:hypothetical protein